MGNLKRRFRDALGDPTLPSVKTMAPRIKVGRPRIGDEADTLTARKPWLAEKMGRSTWYRRQRENGK